MQSRGDNLEAGVAFPGARAIIELAKPPFTIRASPATMGGASTAVSEYGICVSTIVATAAAHVSLFPQGGGQISPSEAICQPNERLDRSACTCLKRPRGPGQSYSVRPLARPAHCSACTTPLLTAKGLSGPATRHQSSAFPTLLRPETKSRWRQVACSRTSDATLLKLTALLA